MTVFRPSGSKAWKARVRHPDGRSITSGCDTTNHATALAMSRWAKGLYNDRHRQGLAVLDAIVSKRVTLPRAFDQRHDLDALLAKVQDVDVEPYVAPWHAEKRKARKGGASADKYLRQVRTLMPERQAFPKSRFTGKVIRTHIRSLKVDDATRNRYKAAFSSFAEYLTDEDILSENVVRRTKGWSEGEGRVVYYERDQAQALIRALNQPFQAIEALMVGAGFEWQAIERLRARDVDLDAKEANAHGGKSQWRNRRCRIVEAWAIEHIRPALVGKFDNQLVFEGITEKRALTAHHNAVKALGLPHSTNHDWRHTHAVLMLRSGYKPTVVAHQLGHRDTSLVWSRYGRFVVDSRDYLLPESIEDSATSPATSTGNNFK